MSVLAILTYNGSSNATTPDRLYALIELRSAFQEHDEFCKIVNDLLRLGSLNPKRAMVCMVFQSSHEAVSRYQPASTVASVAAVKELVHHINEVLPYGEVRDQLGALREDSRRKDERIGGLVREMELKDQQLQAALTELNRWRAIGQTVMSQQPAGTVPELQASPWATKFGLTNEQEMELAKIDENGQRKINAIKAMRTMKPHMGLWEAKAAIEERFYPHLNRVP